MAIKELIARGIGFNPGSTIYIPTLGFSTEAVVVEWSTLQAASGTFAGLQGATDTYQSAQAASDTWKAGQAVESNYGSLQPVTDSWSTSS